MSDSEISRLNAFQRGVMAEVDQLATRHIFHMPTNFIGRMDSAFSEIDDFAADEDEGEPNDDQIDAADSALMDMAALCIGRLVLLRAEYGDPEKREALRKAQAELFDPDILRDDRDERRRLEREE